MTSRWKKVWADFWGNKSRTILTIMPIAVGTFAVGFNSNMALYLTESMDGDFLSASPSEAQIFAYPLDDDMVKIARDMPGVVEVHVVAQPGNVLGHATDEESRNRAGYVRAVADTGKAALTAARRACACIRIETRPTL